MTKHLRFIPWLLIAGLAMLLLGSTFYKALVASFTHDESYTFNHFVTAPVADIFSYKVASPNNHLLNTLMMKASAYCFGNSVIILRMPNIIAHLGFLFFSLALLRKLNPWLILPLFSLLNCNPYLLDFFALARGNGLSCCFMLGSICFFARYACENKTVSYLYAASFAFLGVLSHFTLLYFILSLFLVANLRLFLNHWFRIEKGTFSLRHFTVINAVNLVILLLLAIILYVPVTKLITANQLFYGGESGFWKDTVGTLTETFFYGTVHGSFWYFLARLIVSVTILSTLAFFLVVLLKKDVRLFLSNNMLFIVFMLLMFTIFINISQFYTIGTKLLIRRYGLLFVPMFMLCFCFLSVFLLQYRKIKKLSLLLVCLLALIVSIHTFSAFSATTYLDWEYDKETRSVMAILEKDVLLTKPVQPVTLGITWLYEPSVNFYRITGGFTWLKEVTRDGPAVMAGYYYILREDMTSVPLQGNLPVILFDDGKTMLVKVNRDG